MQARAHLRPPPSANLWPGGVMLGGQKHARDNEASGRRCRQKPRRRNRQGSSDTTYGRPSRNAGEAFGQPGGNRAHDHSVPVGGGAPLSLIGRRSIPDEALGAWRRPPPISPSRPLPLKPQSWQWGGNELGRHCRTGQHSVDGRTLPDQHFCNWVTPGAHPWPPSQGRGPEWRSSSSPPAVRPCSSSVSSVASTTLATSSRPASRCSSPWHWSGPPPWPPPSNRRPSRPSPCGTLPSGFFWVGVSLLAVYHVLWVVYILVLTTIWPLRVVVPK